MHQVLGAILDRHPTLSIIGEAATGMEAISMVAVLEPDGIEVRKQIKAAQPMISTLGLSVIDDEHVIQAMKAAGAEAVLLKDEIHALGETLRQWTLK